MRDLFLIICCGIMLGGCIDTSPTICEPVIIAEVSRPPKCDDWTWARCRWEIKRRGVVVDQGTTNVDFSISEEEYKVAREKAIQDGCIEEGQYGY